MTTAEVRAARERADAATRGPWEIEREELSEDFDDEEQANAFPRSIGPIAYWEPDASDCSDESIAQIEADAAFIAAARADVPALCDEVERLTRELAGERAAFLVQRDEVERLIAETVRLRGERDALRQPTAAPGYGYDDAEPGR